MFSICFVSSQVCCTDTFTRGDRRFEWWRGMSTSLWSRYPTQNQLDSYWAYNNNNYLFGVIIWVRVVFRKIVVGDWHVNYLSGSHLQNQVKSLPQMMVFMPLTTLHLTLKMTTAQVVKTSVTNNSLSKDYPHPDDHAKQITDTPGFKPFTNNNNVVMSTSCQM